MQEQIQQMKSSIANIQHHLKKLEHEETIKICPQSILPESIIQQHEHTYQKPTPSPKITESIPNIKRTQAFIPKRHHLDDTEMKKALRYEQQSLREHKTARNKSSRKNKKRNYSMTIKTKYIYDGGRVVYIPPLMKSHSDYGHIVVQTQKTPRRKKDNFNEADAYHNASSQYGNLQVSNPEPAHKLKIKNKKTKVNLQKNAYQEDLNIQMDQQNLVIKNTKSIRVQCNIKKLKIKQPFIINWNPDTDSQFSGMQI